MRGAAGQEGTAPGVGGGRKWHGAQPGGSAQKHGLGVSDYSRINQCHDRSQLLVQARTGRTGRKRAAPVVVAEDQMPSFPCRSPLTLPFAAPGRLFAPFSSAVPPLHSAQIPTGVLCTGEEPRTAGHGGQPMAALRCGMRERRRAEQGWGQGRKQLLPGSGLGAASPLLQLQLLLRVGQSPTLLSSTADLTVLRRPFELQLLYLLCRAITVGSHPPTSGFCSGDGAARSRGSLFPTPGAGTHRSRTARSAAATERPFRCFASGCESFPHLRPHSQRSASRGTAAPEAHLGCSAAAAAAGNEERESRVSLPPSLPQQLAHGFSNPPPREAVSSAPGENQTPFPAQRCTAQTCSPGLTFPCINPIAASVPG